MARNYKAVKNSFILGILILGVLISLAPITSSGILLNLQSYIEVKWSGDQTSSPVVPRGAISPVDLEVHYVITKGLFGSGVLQLYSGKQAFVKLEVVDSSPWVTATLQSDTVAFPISSESQVSSNIVSFQVSDDAPAYAIGYIKIKASIGKLAGLIEGFEQTYTLNFVASYKPLIKPNLPDTNSKETGPMDTVIFPIEIENAGNDKTIVFFDIESKPDKWTVSITSNVILDAAKGSKGTAYLTIIPDKNFGYHNEDEEIVISMTPARYDNQQDQGETLRERFIVRSRGFSTPGFELIILICAITAIITLMKYKHKKN